MRYLRFCFIYPALAAVCLLLSAQDCHAQTDVDAIMMKKNFFCGGALYGYSSWKDYWEGEYKRNNQNIGTFSSQMFSVMGNYGISNKLNLLFNLPYVQTKASKGTLKGMKGIQDLSLMLKWMPVLKHVGKKGFFSAYGIGGVSFPASNYVADFLPMAIGLRSTNLSARLMADYQQGNFFATASGMFMYRSNIEIDRATYYTTSMHYTNEVKMPHAAGYNIRAGYRSDTWIAEATVESMKTLGGFDIRKNDMPFPSNRMNATQVGVNAKYSTPFIPGLELTAGGKYTITGRNVGQSTSVFGGVFYIMNFSKKEKLSGNAKTPQS
jgi:hypothetical protein